MVAAAIVAALALGFAVAPRLGWATPFSVPMHVDYRGVGFYLDDTKCLTSRELPHGYFPTRRAASVFGYFTGSRSILLPHYEWRRRTIEEGTLLVEVRPSCLKLYVTANQG